MGKKDSYLYIPDDVVAKAEQDSFGHAHIAAAVTESILYTAPPYIIGIFGGWGTGKSSVLELIKSNLNKRRVPTISIDAWRYSSAKSLKRAFLIHVAHEKAPKLLDELRAKLYTTETQTVPPRDSKLDKKADFWSGLSQLLDVVLKVFSKFCLFGVLFFGLLTIIFMLRSCASRGGIGSLNWVEIIDKFIDLAFIPFIVALIDQLRPYISQEPIIVTHERIDADELLCQYFEKVVNAAIRRLSPGKQRLVVFVDNLDRLNDEKMVEALEALKTYLSNRNCIFVVACDDDVVRSVVAKSDKVPRVALKETTDSDAQRLGGEDYLDKFFQQAFRLPAYMEIDLSDFAEEQFSQTQLCSSLKAAGVNIRNLLSTIIPSDVNSPRKVKRLLNEFIALYEVAKRRECEQGGQLRPGTLTGDPEFLGKLSTIRAEFPAFYRKLVNQPSFLDEITNLIRSHNLDSEDNEKMARELLSHDVPLSKMDSLLGYLRKTQTIHTTDIGPYIWLSQDTLALGLSADIVRRLRIALSNGDSQEILDMLSAAKSEDDNVLLAKVASRYVEQRLTGLAQQNGTIVLAQMLGNVAPSARSEIAQVAANLIPQWPLEVFSAEDVLNVLKWATRSERRELVEALLKRLDDGELREKTFEAILRYSEVIDQEDVTSDVQGWLAQILSEEAQRDTDKRDFARWLVGEVAKYSEDQDTIGRYFAHTVCKFIVNHLVALRRPGGQLISGAASPDFGNQNRLSSAN